MSLYTSASRRHRDAIYFIAPTRAGSWRVVKVLEHGPYHDRRPASWRGPYASPLDAQRAMPAPTLTVSPAAQQAIDQIATDLQAARTPPVYSNGDNDQPATCPKCGARTDWEQTTPTVQAHTCLACGYRFDLEFDEDEDADAETDDPHADLIARIQNAMETDTESPTRQSLRMAEAYLGASAEARQLADDLFVCLCGWSLDTLINRPDRAEDAPEPETVRHTTCRHCGQDIEGMAPFARTTWRDRGNNTHCTSGAVHMPVPEDPAP